MTRADEARRLRAAHPTMGCRTIARLLDMNMGTVWRALRSQPQRKIEFPAHFWERVDKDGPTPQRAPHLGGCWIWNSERDLHGYGRMFINRKRHRASRLSWELHNGPIPAGMIVCHHCDNPPCVNPEHLFLGTHKDNADDREAKGRGAAFHGENNGRAKLTAQDVDCIRKLYKTGAFTQRELGAAFGVCDQRVSKIVRNKAWRDDEQCELCHAPRIINHFDTCPRST